MDDKFLIDARRAPRREFAEGLRARLRREEAEPEARAARPRLPGWVAVAAGLAIALGSFALPSVRASAQAFLDLFRVRNFAAVSVDPARLEELHNREVDFKQLIGDNIETLKEPGPPRPMSGAAEASAASGMPVVAPTYFPRGLRPLTTMVQGEGEARFTAHTAKLQQLVTSLGLTDVTIPTQLDGTQVTVHMPPAVHMTYQNDKLEAGFLQARSPEVKLPAGIDLAQIGEIGLRIVGLSRSEAHRFAQTLDWHSTVLVPLPANATSFSEVSVKGNRGLLITTTGEGTNGKRWRQGAVLLWSDGDKVYGLTGNIGTVDLMQMANSIQ